MNNTRQANLLQLRPQIPTAKISESMNSEERFQNMTLRPILKLQHPLFISIFKNYFELRKNAFYDLPLEKRQNYIEGILKKDAKFRAELKGVILGHFTVEEYEIYTKNASAFNKRMMTMLQQRVLSVLEEL